ncbi:MAG: helix-turn-helix domain-containing protein [Clostridium sp.]|nr:helix-turn-helix domain-containing protein [Clostridium sp.]
MNFKDLMLRAKENDRTAIGELLSMYRPLLLKESIVDGIFDEDLYQELCLTLLSCIRKFRV